jgi:hypothetical protein
MSTLMPIMSKNSHLFEQYHRAIKVREYEKHILRFSNYYFAI